MAKKSIPKTNKPDFRSFIPDYSDEEILVILKKKKQYQPEAANLAIREAIKRGLIHSEQDLFSGEFQENKMGFSLFPIIENDRARNKIRKSIARILLITGAVPVIWGGIKIIESQIPEGGLLIILGLIWIYAAAKQLKEVDLNLVNLLFVLLAASIAYIVKIIIALKNPLYMDILIPIFLCSFLAYGLVYIRRLK